jgi:hypothetical protein
MQYVPLLLDYMTALFLTRSVQLIFSGITLALPYDKLINET